MRKEQEVLNTYLPKMLTESEVEEIVAKTIADLGATSMKDMGKVMGQATKALVGRAEGKVISAMVRDLLT